MHFNSGIKNRKDYVHDQQMTESQTSPWTSNVDDSSNSTTIAIIVAALVLVVGAFIFFGSTSTTTPNQQLTGEPKSRRHRLLSRLRRCLQRLRPNEPATPPATTAPPLRRLPTPRLTGPAVI